nr:MAG TPA: hypothetical protein [Caudoviricetes sp.]
MIFISKSIESCPFRFKGLTADVYAAYHLALPRYARIVVERSSYV